MSRRQNAPRLADKPAPWSREQERWAAFGPRNLRRTFNYIRAHGFFWAPSSLDVWRYRGLLRDLDDPCLRGLKSQGALTARELADWLNLEGHLRTKPRRTGIYCVSISTIHDWMNLAWRRGLVTAWPAGMVVQSANAQVRWQLTPDGNEALHSRFVAFLRRMPYTRLLPLLAAGGGAFAVSRAALEWLAVHPTAIVAVFYSLLTVLYVSGLVLWFGRSEKRENPGIAIVAIETLRSAGKPVPAV